MKKLILILMFIGVVSIVAINSLSEKGFDQTEFMALKEKFSTKEKPPVEHSKFPALQKKFSSPQQVTETCISCHNGRHTEVINSNHWNWEREEYIEGRGIVYLGKKNVINNFCIGVQSNEKSCAKCHAGLGMTESGFSFTDSKNIDCLICHDNSETYVKAPEKGGAPDLKLDFNKIAQSVGKPKRSNCGVCHFFGGGGNNVKHGDLEKSMFQPTREVDVHMSINNSNMECTDCHKTEKHNISGKMYSLSSMNRNRATCESCHSSEPHEKNILNEHTIKVACQTCHIPTYAKVNATKTEWDWSTAGKLKNGEPFKLEDSEKNISYMSMKGSFKWGKNLTPEYIWFNGTASHYLLGDKITDTTKPLVLNKLNGSYNDTESKIVPVKVHRANQPYDPINKILIQPKLFSEKKGEGAFWKDFNWIEASEVGMKGINLPFSGKISFIKTEMNWPVNHMVSTKEESVKCNECHKRENGRLAGLTDFYMPGRDYNNFVEGFGSTLLVMSIVIVVVHGAVRISVKKNNKGRK